MLVLPLHLRDTRKDSARHAVQGLAFICDSCKCVALASEVLWFPYR